MKPIEPIKIGQMQKVKLFKMVRDVYPDTKKYEIDDNGMMTCYTTTPISFEEKIFPCLHVHWFELVVIHLPYRLLRSDLCDTMIRAYQNFETHPVDFLFQRVYGKEE